MLLRPIHLDLDNGWKVDFTEREGGALNVLVTSPGGRSWTTDKATMAEAIEVSVRIRDEQRLQDESRVGIG